MLSPLPFTLLSCLAQLSSPPTAVSFDVKQTRVCVADAGGRCRVVPLASDNGARALDVSSHKVCVPVSWAGFGLRIPALVLEAQQQGLLRPLQGFTAAAFFPHPSISTLIVTAENHGVVSIWDAVDGSLQWQVCLFLPSSMGCMSQVPIAVDFAMIQIPLSSTHATGATALACSHNDSVGDSDKFGVGVFATCGSDGLVNVFDATTKQ
jgi:WD40 repeat protein